MKAKTGPKKQPSIVGKSSAEDLAMKQNLVADLGTLQSDIEKVFQDQKDVVTRPNILYSLAATVATTLGVAYYNGTVTVPHLAMKAIYATVSQIIGINIGLAAQNENVDNIAFAGGYYTLNSISGGLRNYNKSVGMEALAGAVVGYATNYYLSS